MRILVVGSNSEQDGQFAHACYLLGQELARARCDVILGSNRYSTADHHVMRGLLSVLGIHKVILIRPFEDAHIPTKGRPFREPDTQPFADEPKTSELPPGSLKFEYVPIRGPWGVGRVARILRSDAVIAIGGRSGTRVAIGSRPGNATARGCHTLVRRRRCGSMECLGARV